MTQTAKADHTPGPWIAVRNPYLRVRGFDIFPTYRTPTTPPIANVDDANADLIAAAPTMYEALQAMMVRFEHTGEAWMSDPAMEQARAAIRLAEGEK